MEVTPAGASYNPSFEDHQVRGFSVVTWMLGWLAFTGPLLCVRPLLGSQQ